MNINDAIQKQAKIVFRKLSRVLFRNFNYLKLFTISILET